MKKKLEKSSFSYSPFLGSGWRFHNDSGYERFLNSDSREISTQCKAHDDVWHCDFHGLPTGCMRLSHSLSFSQTHTCFSSDSVAQARDLWSRILSLVLRREEQIATWDVHPSFLPGKRHIDNGSIIFLLSVCTHAWKV